MDTNQPSNTLSRRKFVKIGATGAATLFILPALSGCGSENGEAQTDEAEGGAGAQQKTATLAFRGGTIQTMTSENDVAEALAVDGNEIVYVGDEAGLEAFVGSGTKVIDLEGGMVVGKSTILNRSVNSLTALEGGALSNGSAPGVHFVFSPEDATQIHFDVIRSFDRPLIHSELLEKMADKNVKTELDWQLYQLQRRYLDYQVNIGNRIIECLTSGGPDGQLRAAEMSYPKTKFQNLMDDLFGETGKKIIRKSNEILFEQDGDILYPYQLSSGEKQILVILLTVLVQDNRRGVLFMDEPEVSLHVEWQQRLISLIRQLNPNVQIVLTTHSPAVIMDGWLDAVTEVSDITK